MPARCGDGYSPGEFRKSQHLVPPSWSQPNLRHRLWCPKFLRVVCPGGCCIPEGPQRNPTRVGSGQPVRWVDRCGNPYDCCAGFAVSSANNALLPFRRASPRPNRHSPSQCRVLLNRSARINPPFGLLWICPGAMVSWKATLDGSKCLYGRGMGGPVLLCYVVASSPKINCDVVRTKQRKQVVVIIPHPGFIAFFHPGYQVCSGKATSGRKTSRRNKTRSATQIINFAGEPLFGDHLHRGSRSPHRTPATSSFLERICCSDSVGLLVSLPLLFCDFNFFRNCWKSSRFRSGARSTSFSSFSPSPFTLK